MKTMKTRRRRWPWLLFAAIVLVLLAVRAFAVWGYRDYLRSPGELYQRAQAAKPERAAELYALLAGKAPALEEYARLWTAEAQMPDLEAMRTLRALIDFEPQSPLAYLAHTALARHYASIEAPEAADEYRAALDLYESAALRLELARYLEQQGDVGGAYAEYRALLPTQPDAFQGMRRTAKDPLAVAQDLISATFYSDALETLHGSTDPKALPLRAQAYSGLRQYEEARTAFQAWLQSNPDDQAAQMGLAKALANLGRAKEALAIYQPIKTPDSQLAQADLLAESDPKQALALDSASPYPVAWWNATRILEAQKRITETLPLYQRLAQTDTDFADDAAYRLTVLGKRTGDRQAEAQGKALLKELGPNWLAIRANEGVFSLPAAPPFASPDAAPGSAVPAGGAAGSDILARAEALESIGRKDLARLELVLASRARRAPEVDLAAASELSARGHVSDAQAIAERYIKDHKRAPLAFWQLSYPRPYSDTVNAAATEFNVDPLLIWAVMREESRFDPDALSYAGARGLMQIMPTTQTWIAEKLDESIPPGDAFHPEPNIRMGAWNLRFLIDYFKGDLELALMAYNGGAASVESWLKDPRVANRDDLLRWIGYGETREYIERVSLSYRVYQELYADGADASSMREERETGG
jgi:soluble lytic murein transglycosylase